MRFGFIKRTKILLRNALITFCFVCSSLPWMLDQQVSGTDWTHLSVFVWSDVVNQMKNSQPWRDARRWPWSRTWRWVSLSLQTQRRWHSSTSTISMALHSLHLWNCICSTSLTCSFSPCRIRNLEPSPGLKSICYISEENLAQISNWRKKNLVQIVLLSLFFFTIEQTQNPRSRIKIQVKKEEIEI